MVNNKLVLNAFIEEIKNGGVIDFTNITPKKLNISEKEFITALRELENQGIIKGIVWGDNDTYLIDDIQIYTKNIEFH